MADSQKSLEIVIKTRADLEATKRTEQALKANQEEAERLANNYVKVTKEQAAQILSSQKSVEQDAKEFASKRELKHALHGLAEEFPLLASVGRMALNPIVLVTAAIGAAFEIFRHRVEGATKALAGMQLPDSKALDPGRINQATEAWRNLKDALRDAAEQYNSVDAAAERVSKTMQAAAEEQRKNLESRKALALAALEARKGTMSESDYDEQKRAIEARFGHAAMAGDWVEQQRQLDLKKTRAELLDKSAREKNLEAAKIRVATPEGEAQIMQDRKAAADEAQKDIKERMDRMTRLQGMRGSTFEQVKGAWWFNNMYGASSMDPEKDIARAMGIEQEGLSRARDVVEGFRGYAGGAAGRAAQRKRKEQLQADATKEATEAQTIRMGLPAEQAALDAATKGNIGRWNRAGLTELTSMGLLTTPGKAESIFDQGMAAADARAHGKKLTEQQEAQEQTMKTMLEAIGWNMDSVVAYMRSATNKHKAHDAEIKALRAELDQVRAQVKGSNAVFGK